MLFRSQVQDSLCERVHVGGFVLRPMCRDNPSPPQTPTLLKRIDFDSTARARRQGILRPKASMIWNEPVEPRPPSQCLPVCNEKACEQSLILQMAWHLIEFRGALL